MNLSAFAFCYCLPFEYHFACKLHASYFLVCCMIVSGKIIEENILNIPKLPLTVFPPMPNISFSAHGIQLLLENLVPGKAPGPDGLSTYIFKYCASEIAPILQVLYTQSLSTGTLANCKYHTSLQERQSKYTIKLQTNILNFNL